MWCLFQVQVYAISGEGHPGSPSALHVLHGCQVLDMLFKSPAEYEGVTGLWSIPIGPADITSALVVMSFASGSRAMTAGELSRTYHFACSPVRSVLCACMPWICCSKPSHPCGLSAP